MANLSGGASTAPPLVRAGVIAPATICGPWPACASKHGARPYLGERVSTRDAPYTDRSMRPGQRIGDRFEIERLAGTGGMGAVYRARDVKDGALVAIKV